MDTPGDRPPIADDIRRQHVEAMLRSHGLCVASE
jgi:hypothetical protein